MNSTLPETYDRDTLHMIARDPSTLYLYWELSAGKKRMAESHFERQWDELPKRIRLYDATRVQFNGTNARKIWEWPIARGAFCYFHHADPARRYVADLGVAGAGGQFLPMVRSNPVETPMESSGTTFGAEQHSLSRIGGDYSVMTQADGVQLCNYIDLSAESAVGPGNGLPNRFEQYSAYTLYPATRVIQ
ncbi:MAG: hypothetical protein K0R75_3203 [Paenibacillaceae bacterium]|jgi:hypothetical protein|nr:hypothetical protein [Paenibacillaceae bacterium]